MTRFNNFPVLRGVSDEQSYFENPPEGAKLLVSPGIHGGHYVPVAFVAKDWKVSTRRIRSLLAMGRLLGRQADNGYWEVRYPYAFTFGTRGPCLKRQENPKRRAKKPELKAV